MDDPTFSPPLDRTSPDESPSLSQSAGLSPEQLAVVKEVGSKMLRDRYHNEGNDVVSRVEYRLYQARQKHGPDAPRNPRAWTVRATVRACLDILKSRGYKESRYERVEASDFQGTDDIVRLPLEDQVLFREVIAALKDECARDRNEDHEKDFEIIELALEGHTEREIAAKLDISRYQVSKAIDRAVGRIERVVPAIASLILAALVRPRHAAASRTAPKWRMLPLVGAMFLCGDIAPAAQVTMSPPQNAREFTAPTPPSMSSAEIQAQIDLIRRLSERSEHDNARQVPGPRRPTGTPMTPSRRPRISHATRGTADEDWQNVTSSPVTYLGDGRTPTLSDDCETCNSLHWSVGADGRFVVESQYLSLPATFNSSPPVCGVSRDEFRTSFRCEGARVGRAVFMECENAYSIRGCTFDASNTGSNTYLLVGKVRDSNWIVGNAWKVQRRGGECGHPEAPVLGDAEFFSPWAMRQTASGSSCFPYIPWSDEPDGAPIYRLNFIPMEPVGLIEQVCDRYSDLPACQYGPFRFLRTNRDHVHHSTINVELISSDPWEGMIGIFDGRRKVQECTNEQCSFLGEHATSVFGLVYVSLDDRGMTLLAPEGTYPSGRFVPSSEFDSTWWCDEGTPRHMMTFNTEDALDAAFGAP